MKETRFFYAPDAELSLELPADESLHAVKVLRLRPGDELMLMDGKGTFYRAEVTLTDSRHCLYRIVECLPQPPQWKGHIHLAIAPTKMNERIEWMAEKATEVGIDELSFLECQFSERRQLKEDRVRRIVVAAVKQSRKSVMPIVNEMMTFKEFIAAHNEGRRYIAHCYEEVARRNLFTELCRIDPTENVTVLVGPEGDFSIDEVRMAVEAGYVSVDLGKSRLRTETAGLSAVMMVQLSKQKQE